MTKQNSITILEARIKLSDLVEDAYRTGQQTIITKNGTPRAKIVPLSDEELIKVMRNAHIK